jgi:HAD superfamily hydrolase (TIGR01484 family)
LFKMAIFDLDGTLAEQGEPIGPRACDVLLSLERSGVHVVLCSGKPTYYLVGIARQVGLKDVSFIGETGFAVQVGTELPPVIYHEREIPADTRRFLSGLADVVKREVPRVWFQPNSGSMTVFFYDEEGRERLETLLRQAVANRDDVQLFAQPDCFDVTPGVTKADGIDWLLQSRSVTPEEVIYVGDGENDQPAFDVIPCSVAIDPALKLRARERVNTTDEALDRVLELTKVEEART